MNMASVNPLTVALIINPVAGIGGPLALKGSDGMAKKALAMGAVLNAENRVVQALTEHLDSWNQVHWVSGTGSMGGDLLNHLNLDWTPLDYQVNEPTSADDTKALAELILKQGADILLFAGGDGTARDICSVIGDSMPVLGIPAGVKIHSSVYAVTPHAAGEVLNLMRIGKLVDVRHQEVRDIDEVAFRNNQVKARYFGEMKVPDEGHYIQHTKTGGIENEELVLNDIADYIVDTMDDDVVYLIGSGKTTAMIMENLGLPNTLLGIDAIENKQLLASDLNEKAILSLLESHKVFAIISVIGGQGHVLGRGNQQLSPAVVRKLGQKHIQVVSTKTKLNNLDGRPLILDSGDSGLDQQLSGHWEVLTGYNDRVLYPVTTF